MVVGDAVHEPWEGGEVGRFDCRPEVADNEARARLAAQAPAMARALERLVRAVRLEIASRPAHLRFTGPDLEDADREAEQILHAAGVLP